VRQAFISHSSKDQDWVDWIAREIEPLGVRAYLAAHDPKLGRPPVGNPLARQASEPPQDRAAVAK
jgi:hypothetical protein